MIEILFKTIITAPLIWILILALVYFIQIQVKEYILSESVKYYSIGMAFLTFVLFVLCWIHSPRLFAFDFEDWITLGNYRFKIRFIVDLLGATYALLSAVLIGIIFRFSRNYLHKEEGYFRFIFLLSMLLFGLLVVSFARSLDLLFAGWELVGTTSVLLISYFYNKPQPVRHALKAIISYRLCDMGILAASAYAHHHLHSTDFTAIPKLLEHAHSASGICLIGIFIIWASLAKAGQLPMSSWLPTAMEGPTPSSAIFYGALSVHLGPFLLLRLYDYLAHFPALLWIIGIIGALSAIYATLVGRTRSDAKTMLAYATITQVGIIFIEIALGLTNFAIFHIVAHASLRTWQFLRSSSLIQDFFENPMVEHEKNIERSLSIERFVSKDIKKRIYIHALHGFHIDYINHKLIFIFCSPMRGYIKLERKWMDLNNKIIKKLIGKDIA